MERPDWNRQGRDWPNREASRFVSAARLNWHVQVMGRGPALLLLHGTGAASHSWRDVAPRLADRYTVIVPDLPGHGFTAMPPSEGMSLPGMAMRVAALVSELGLAPGVVVGHSAGAAIAIQMALDLRLAPDLILSLNGAIKPIRGAGVFSPLARLLFLNPLAPRLFSWRAQAPGATERLLAGTGSTIDARGVALYERLFRTAGHIEATLGMMAAWDLDDLPRRIAQLNPRLLLVAAAGDRAIPPGDATELARRTPRAEALLLPTGGHLVHEERPDEIAALIAGRAAAEHA
ncbi:alpha/beta fold hydrolase BchO [Aquibium microcysteis]|uniref:alpha/beta fold hydrolase BchO n=1 Tax=Aquibium microcysteis TaxID=675281 RepID=UPI00165CFF40|nr:alpha/beta fold hydrolase BchO [Aquibium microcysteis]